MRIIITGAAGFVGSNLVEAFLSQGHEVIGIDNFSYGSWHNIKRVTEQENFTFLERDVRDKRVFEGVEGECLVHLASQKIPRYTNAYNTLGDNYVMLKNAIDKCLADNIKLVFSSTSDVYGKNPDLPYHEESNLVMGPTTVKRWAYALSKIYGEHTIIATHQEHGLDYTIMRFFGSYGPHQNTTWWGGPQAIFIQNLLEGKQLEIHGDGQQTRTFTYVEDTVDGVVRCTLDPNAKNEIFNVANEPDEEVTILELANIVIELMGITNPEDHLKLIPYSTFGKYEDVRRRVPSIDKIKSTLNYAPKTKLRDGLVKTIAWQKELYRELQQSNSSVSA